MKINFGPNASRERYISTIHAYIFGGTKVKIKIPLQNKIPIELVHHHMENHLLILTELQKNEE